ncbi:GNAT family N-acetyltransferase [Corallococcus sicarius]|uniref:GNAT family N-acetyltransferase n=1 Tax=Corallococcus sicarius TaxID=2316726 RepID=A0A3A8MZF6_9BACT|nr:GNAT family N-acetyltransferase [Corallococcus sicarius]RKH37618.1 GNAT family N-acetyltransferase [Corallococcus sicarius]
MSVSIDVRNEVRLASDEAEVRRCFKAFKELRPHLKSEEDFVERWRAQAAEGYRLVFLQDGDAVPAAAGYRFLHTMAWGHILYIDDLVAVASRHRTGLGSALLRHLQDEARRLGCDAVHLDTGYQRHLAHRSYLRNGFRIECHHMAWEVTR